MNLRTRKKKTKQYIYAHGNEQGMPRRYLYELNIDTLFRILSEVRYGKV